MSTKPKLYLAIYDLHWPRVHWPTMNAAFDFLKHNKVDGFIFGGDQFDNACISHHNKSKPYYRPRAAYVRDESTFKERILEPLDVLLKGVNDKVWITGNHDFWEFQLVEEQPELEGVIDRPTSLKLRQRGWKVVDCGESHRVGKLNFIHGEWLTGIGNQGGTFPAKKAVELFSGNVLAGHTHSPQSFTKVSPVHQTQKWMAWISPIAGACNADYMRNRPSAWVNGMTVVQFHGAEGSFNCFPCVVTNGRFSYGGRVYSGDGKG